MWVKVMSGQLVNVDSHHFIVIGRPSEDTGNKWELVVHHRDYPEHNIILFAHEKEGMINKAEQYFCHATSSNWGYIDFSTKDWIREKSVDDEDE